MYPKTMILAVLMVAASAKADITVTDWELVALARYDHHPDVVVIETAPPVTLPFSVVSTATAIESEATSTYNFDAVGDVGSFEFDFEHVRAGHVNSNAVAVGSMLFSISADSDLFYSVDGAYAMIGSNRINLYAELRDVTTSTVLFRSSQVSYDTPNESFTLGETGGDSSNILTGSLTGTLTAGHEYWLNYSYFIALDAPSGDSGATAVGSLNLDITRCPAPSTCPADLNGDGVVDAADLAMLLGSWGACSK